MEGERDKPSTPSQLVTAYGTYATQSAFTAAPVSKEEKVLVDSVIIYCTLMLDIVRQKLILLDIVLQNLILLDVVQQILILPDIIRQNFLPDIISTNFDFTA